MKKLPIEWSNLNIKDLIEMQVLVPYWEKLPCRLIVILKQEYKEDVFKYAYEVILKNSGYEHTTFFNACGVIETWSSTNLKNARGLPEWNAKQYWHYLHRKKLNKEYFFFGDKMKNRRNKKRWLREMAQISYCERLNEKKEYF